MKNRKKKKDAHSPIIYPSNVISDTQSRQQIATVLQSMGFETDDIQQAFCILEDQQTTSNTFEKQKYDISVLTEIVVQIQTQNSENNNSQKHIIAKSKSMSQNNHNLENNNINHQIQSYSAPNSPNIPKNANITNEHKQQYNNNNDLSNSNSMQILHSMRDHRNNKHNANDHQNNQEMMDIFSSLQINNNNNIQNNCNTIGIGKRAMSSSPLIKPSANNRNNNNCNTNVNQNMDLMSILKSLSEYSTEENEVIEVLSQTLNNKRFVLDNMQNWSDLYQNISRRKNEWKRFQKQFENWIYQNCNKNENNCKTNGIYKTKNEKTKTMLEKSLSIEFENAKKALVSSKESLLITANTYAILKNNKLKTEQSIQNFSDKISEINHSILRMQNEKKQIVNALQRTQNKLQFQIESIRETEISIKELHEKSTYISENIVNIEKSKKCVSKLENQLNSVHWKLKYKFENCLEQKWKNWKTNDVIVWILHISSDHFDNNNSSELIHSIRDSGLCGKDLPQMNDFILRSFKLNLQSDRDLFLKNVKRIVLKNENKNGNETTKRSNNNNNIEKDKEQTMNNENMCVICNDGEANHIMIPCGHIAVCSKCVDQIKVSRKCAFCGTRITNVIKCFHVGV